MVAHAGLTALRVERVTNADDPRLDGYRRLVDPAGRRADLFVVESQEVVRRLLDARRYRFRSLLATEAALEALLPALAAVEPPPAVLVADVALLRDVTGFTFHRGCLALAERGGEPSLGGVLAAIPSGPARVLVLDEVSNPDNVGALFRNAAAFGVRAMLLSAGSGDPLYRKAIRVSMGETLHLPYARLGPWPEGSASLRAHGFALVALSPEGDDLEGFVPVAPQRLALVVGAEGAGVSAAARARAQSIVGIRMRAGADSLNVAVATAVALYRLTH
jgi:tRNA G18 (ribose-2'-O)-methylase SpoU